MSLGESELPEGNVFADSVPPAPYRRESESLLEVCWLSVNATCLRLV